MIILFAIAAVVGYILGSLPFGYLVARANGVDIFKEGSCNPGATNVKRVLGAKAGNTVYILDALKGVVAAGWPFAICFLFMRPGPATPPYDELCSRASMLGVTGLVAAVFGHSFSCFTRFKGGKGVATASGGLLVLVPVPGLVAISVWLVTFLATRYVSLASILSAVSVLTTVWLLDFQAALKIVATVLALLVIARHAANIRRLLNGTEHRWTRKQ